MSTMYHTRYHTGLRTLTASVLLFLTASLPAVADPYDDGLAAYKKGDWAAAYRILKPIAETDSSQSAVAQQRLGLLTEFGRGTAKDPTQAATWYRKAADQGDMVAQGHLGRLYRLGTGVPRDAAQAAKWSIKAASQGNAAAQANLGYMSLDGFGLPADPAAAAAWFKRSADQGDASGMLGLATLCEAGRGVPKDVVQAAKWYTLASVDDGEYDEEMFARAKKARTALEAKMTPAQIAEADKLAQDFTPVAKR
jgi:TPR repeat protein